MSTIQEIEKAISKLPPEDLAVLRAWFDRVRCRVWRSVSRGGRFRGTARQPGNAPQLELAGFDGTTDGIDDSLVVPRSSTDLKENESRALGLQWASGC